MSLTPGVNTWISLADANIYFATRVGAHKYWYTGILKEAALVTAYNQLVSCGLFDFPVSISINMKNAQCEMALFLLIHQEDMDSRMGLQAQGVTQAGIVQETYDSSKVDGLPIPPMVKSFLKEYISDDNSSMQITEAQRDDDEEVI